MSKSGLFHAHTLLLAISEEISPKYTPFQCAAGGACGWENRRNRARVGLFSVLVHGRVFLSMVGFSIFTQAEWTSNRSSYTDLLFTYAPRSRRPHKAAVLPRCLTERGGYVKALGPESQTTSYARRPHVEQSVSQATPWAFIKKSLAESGRIHCGFSLIAALPHLYASLNTLPTRLCPPH